MRVNLTLHLKNLYGTIGSKQSVSDELQKMLTGLQVATPEATHIIKLVRVKGSRNNDL